LGFANLILILRFLDAEVIAKNGSFQRAFFGFLMFVANISEEIAFAEVDF